MSHELRIEKNQNPKKEIPAAELEFGKYFTDHMFLMDYSADKEWHDPRIIPYGPFTLDPAAKVLHYGQAIFEGMKAYRTKENQINLFRPDKNVERMNISNVRMGIPPIDAAAIVGYIKTLVTVDQDWVPYGDGTSLYIRPFIIATESSLGVHASNKYLFAVIMSPVGSYYKEGINPVKINVESQYVRAVRGGTGFAKTAGNYASSIKAQEEAEKVGFSQVLWLDGIEHSYIEEVGNMNVFFKINGEIVTPALNGSILNGITRNTVIQLLRDWGVSVTEKKLSIQELHKAYLEGRLEEAFGTGTAAVISPIGELNWETNKMAIHYKETGELWKKLYDTITGIQNGTVLDPYGWTVPVTEIAEQIFTT